MATATKKPRKAAAEVPEAATGPQFVVRRKEFLAACKWAAEVCPSRNIKPVLQCLKLEFGQNTLRISATDLERGVTAYLTDGVHADSSDTYLLPADLLVNALSQFTADDVHFQPAEDCVVLSGGCRLVLRTCSAEFPDISEPTGDPSCKVMVSILNDLFKQVQPVVGGENSRFSFQSIRWAVAKGRLELQATDGNAAVIASAEAPLQSDTPPNDFLVPPSAIKLAVAGTHTSEEDVSVWLSPNEIYFRTSSTLVYSRLIEGRFPPLREVLGKAKKKATFQAKASVLVRATKQAALVLPNDAHGVWVTAKAGTVVFEARDQSLGESLVEIKAEVDGSDRVTLKAPYLIEALRALPVDADVTAESCGHSPFIFRLGNNYTLFLQPMT